jgi:hypothetical protein
MRVRGNRRNADVTRKPSNRNQGKNDTVSLLLTSFRPRATHTRSQTFVTADAMPQRMTVAGKAGCLFATLSGLPACRNINGSLQSGAVVRAAKSTDGSSAEADDRVTKYSCYEFLEHLRGGHYKGVGLQPTAQGSPDTLSS